MITFRPLVCNYGVRIIYWCANFIKVLKSSQVSRKGYFQIFIFG